MPLVFELITSSRVPILVPSLIPKSLTGKSNSAICSTPIGFGNQSASVGDLFRVSGRSDDGEIVFRGDLANVHRIGSELSEGKITVEGSTGRHTGASMNGGVLTVHGNVGDFAGFEMRGGNLHVIGNAGDQVGGCFPGASVGMNRGTICVTGNAGNGIGYRMRRGTIVVGGDAGELTGWQMRAGSLIIGGRCEGRIGVDMRRGTIVTGPAKTDIESALGATFSQGMHGRFEIISMLGRWLESHLSEFGLPLATLFGNRLGKSSLTCWHGDTLAGGRGEVFLQSETSC